MHCLSKSLFERSLMNGQRRSWTWLIYSENIGRVCCGQCLVSMESHSLKQKISVIGKMLQDESRNTKIRTVANLASVKGRVLAVATALFSTFLQYAMFSFNWTLYTFTPRYVGVALNRGHRLSGALRLGHSQKYFRVCWAPPELPSPSV
jgi:hypothetical protein